MLKKGTKIEFVQISILTGNKIKYHGEIIGHAKEVRKMWPVECGEVVNPVYLIKCEDPYGNTFHHMIFPEEVFFTKLGGNPEEEGHLLKYLRKNQAYKAGIRADKEKKRRENYFK